MNKEIKIYLESVDKQAITGWFINSPNPEENKLMLYLDGAYKAITVADKERVDVAEIHGQLRSGFSFDRDKYPIFNKIELRTSAGKMILTADVSFENESVLQDSLMIKSPYSAQRQQQLKQLSIDFSQRIEGDNWYANEPTGCWAGPGLESTLTIPALDMGRYRLAIAIENEYCDLKTMQVKLNGTPFKFISSDYNVPVVLDAEVTVDQELPCWGLAFQFTKTSPPEGENGADQRRLGAFFKTINLTKI